MATLKWLNRTERAVAALLSATVLFLLIVAASHAGALWRDECNSIQLARMSNLAEVRENYPFESFPVLFPIILRGFTDLFGTSDTALRTFGCVVGVTLLVVAWWNARVFQTVPLLFPPLIGLNTIFLVWGITVRGYGLGTALIALGLGLAVNALLRPGIKSFIALAIGWLAAVQVLYFNLMLVAAFAAGTIAAFLWRRQPKYALVVAIIAAVCATSYAPYFRMYAGIDWNVVVKLPVTLASVWERLTVACGEPTRWSLVLYLFLFAAALLGALAGLIWLAKAQTTDGAELCLAIISCVLAPIGFYFFLHQLSYAPKVWYFLALFAVVAAAMELIASVLSRIVWVRFLRLVIVVGILVVFPFAGWRQLHRPHTNIDTVAQKLRQEAKPNDLIVVNPWSVGVSFNWYYHGKTPWVTVPEIAEHRSHRHDMYKAKMMEPFPLDDLEEAIRATLRLGNRVWLAGNVDILPPGKSPLSPLAAPDPEFGWRQSVYRTAWSQQLGRFLREHVSQLSVVLRPTLNVHGEENLLILVAEGWHD